MFGDTYGQLFGFGADADPSQPDRPLPGWSSSYQIPHGSGSPIPVYCSPLIAGTKGGACTEYIGADNGYVYMLDPSNETYIGTLGPLNGAIRSSMAAYNGRLYVLTVGSPTTTPATAPKLYCYGS